MPQAESAHATFNADIGAWYTSKVDFMNYRFDQKLYRIIVLFLLAFKRELNTMNVLIC